MSRSPLRKALPRRVYECAGNTEVIILIETNAVRLTLDKQIYNLRQVDSASGAKYAAGSVVWFAEGDTGQLEDDADPAHPAILAKDCHIQNTFPPAIPQRATLTGTVFFAKHPTLPSDAVLTVEVRKPGDPVDNLAGALHMAVNSAASPVKFGLQFEPIDGQLTVSVNITSAGNPVFCLKAPITIAGNTLAPPAVHLTLSPVSH